jgi:hypothetical protein
MITPITNCQPKLIYSAKEDELPTIDNYEKISTKNITLQNASHLVVGVVTDEEMCLYDLILLTDTYGMQFLVDGIPQNIIINPNSSKYLLFNAHRENSFQVQSNYPELSIYIN